MVCGLRSHSSSVCVACNLRPYQPLPAHSDLHKQLVTPKVSKLSWNIFKQITLYWASDGKMVCIFAWMQPKPRANVRTYSRIGFRKWFLRMQCVLSLAIHFMTWLPRKAKMHTFYPQPQYSFNIRAAFFLLFESCWVPSEKIVHDLLCRVLTKSKRKIAPNAQYQMWNAWVQP